MQRNGEPFQIFNCILIYSVNGQKLFKSLDARGVEYVESRLTAEGSI